MTSAFHLFGSGLQQRLARSSHKEQLWTSPSPKHFLFSFIADSSHFVKYNKIKERWPCSYYYLLWKDFTNRHRITLEMILQQLPSPVNCYAYLRLINIKTKLHTQWTTIFLLHAVNTHMQLTVVPVWCKLSSVHLGISSSPGLWWRISRYFTRLWKGKLPSTLTD